MQESTLTFAEIISGARIIPLTKGQICFVDEEDYEWLNQWKWSASKKGYAKRNFRVGVNKRKCVVMHRLIMGNPLFEVDHQNQIKSDNRRFNLRVATSNEGQWNRGKQKNNTSGFKGVHKRKECNKWRAHITVFRKRINLGSFDSPEEAHAAYCAMGKKLHGEFFSP